MFSSLFDKSKEKKRNIFPLPKPDAQKMGDDKDDLQEVLETLTKNQQTMADILINNSKSAEAMQEILNKIASGVFTSESTKGPKTTDIEFFMESISNSISSEFIYDPENGSTFEKWFSKYSDLFSEDAKRLDDKQKVRVLLRKLGTREHELYESHILPKTQGELSFADTIKTELEETVS